MALFSTGLYAATAQRMTSQNLYRFESPTCTSTRYEGSVNLTTSDTKEVDLVEYQGYVLNKSLKYPPTTR